MNGLIKVTSTVGIEVFRSSNNWLTYCWLHMCWWGLPSAPGINGEGGGKEGISSNGNDFLSSTITKK